MACFDPKLEPYLLHLKDQFTSIALQYAIQLRSVYAIRIYELLKQYQRLRQRTLAVAELRRMLAIDEHKYTLIKDFRRRVIDIAQREVNAKTDLCFAYEAIKTGRRITHFRFRIAANVPTPGVKPRPDSHPQNVPLRAEITSSEAGISPPKTRENIKNKNNNPQIRECCCFSNFMNKRPDLGQWATQNRQREKRRDGAPEGSSMLRRV